MEKACLTEELIYFVFGRRLRKKLFLLDKIAKVHLLSIIVTKIIIIGTERIKQNSNASS